MQIPVLDAIIQGSTRPTIPFVMSKNDGSIIVCTGGNFTGKRRKLEARGKGVAIAGSISVTDGPNGEITMSYDDADVATAGRILFQITGVISGGTYIRFFIQPIDEAI